MQVQRHCSGDMFDIFKEHREASVVEMESKKRKVGDEIREVGDQNFGSCSESNGSDWKKPFLDKWHDVTCLFKGPPSECRERAEARRQVWMLLQ